MMAWEYSDPDEQRVFDERIAILLDGAQRDPTDAEIALAMADVERFHNEQAQP